MAKPIHHTASGAVAETANSGIMRGTLGAIAGGLVAAAIVIGVPALAASALVGALIPAMPGLATAAAVITGSITGFLGMGWIGAGAAIGGGAGAFGGITKTSSRIHDEEMAAKNVGNGHDLEMMQQMSEVRQQAAEQYTKMGYAQGVQDGQVAVMQQLQQAAMQQQMAQAENAEPGKYEKKIIDERGGEEKVELAAKANHQDRVEASKAGENALGA